MNYKMTKTVNVNLNIRCYDDNEVHPREELHQIQLNTDIGYDQLKTEIQKLCGVYQNDEKVIKIRDSEHNLIPMMNLLEATEEDIFIVDVTNVNYTNRSPTTLLQEAYHDALSKNLRNMESRVAQVEMLVPQLKLRRQAHMEQTISTLSSRVAFLNRRIDELMPAEWKSKMPQTMA